ncbi:MAG: hypothetical protein NZZ41_04680 [Candidatus Dojkabacteria bacterium]|nr:hypothetical protein [Candidatus Dojkabacteria bacterium]
MNGNNFSLNSEQSFQSQSPKPLKPPPPKFANLKQNEHTLLQKTVEEKEKEKDKFLSQIVAKKIEEIKNLQKTFNNPDENKEFILISNSSKKKKFKKPSYAASDLGVFYRPFSFIGIDGKKYVWGGLGKLPNKLKELIQYEKEHNEDGVSITELYLYIKHFRKPRNYKKVYKFLPKEVVEKYLDYL